VSSLGTDLKRNLEPSDYGLLRASFQLDPQIDCGIFVGRHDIRERLEDRLKRAHLTKSSMHSIIWGDYGSGKTHTLNYVQRYLGQLKVDALPIFVRAPRIQEKSTPSDLYASIMESISTSALLDLFAKIYDQQSELQKTTDHFQRVAIIDKIVQNKDLSVVIHKYNKSRPQEDYLVVKWLSGQKLSAKERETLGVISDNADQFTASKTILSILQLFSQFEKKFVLLMIDEMESIELVKEKRELEFEKFLRPIADEKQAISLLIAFSHDGTIESGPRIFQPKQALGGRVGYPQNYINLMPFDSPASMECFVAELMNAKGIRDPSVDIDSLIKKGERETDEKLSRAYFPFTDEATALMFQLFQQATTPRLVSPRAILKSMTECLGEAMNQGKLAITTEIVQKVLGE